MACNLHPHQHRVPCPLCENEAGDAINASLRASSPQDIRDKGWAVTVHNDYRQGGESHTFWEFSKGNRCVRGEGRTDAEALNIVRTAIEGVESEWGLVDPLGFSHNDLLVKVQQLRRHNPFVARCLEVGEHRDIPLVDQLLAMVLALDHYNAHLLKQVTGDHVNAPAIVIDKGDWADGVAGRAYKACLEEIEEELRHYVMGSPGTIGHVKRLVHRALHPEDPGRTTNPNDLPMEAP